MEEVSDKRLAIMSKEREAAKVKLALRRKIKALLITGDITDLEKKTMENWAVMIDSQDPQERAFATKEVSKYLFPTKRDHQDQPKVEITCNFIGIKDKKDDEEK